MQDDLKATVSVWNMHKIRKSSRQNGSAGRPRIMYNTPELFDTHDYIEPVTAFDVEICRARCIEPSKLPCDENVFDLCVHIMNEKQFEWPDSPEEGINLYFELRSEIKAELD
jgi:hypothetical protein